MRYRTAYQFTRLLEKQESLRSSVLLSPIWGPGLHRSEEEIARVKAVSFLLFGTHSPEIPADFSDLSLSEFTFCEDHPISHPLFSQFPPHQTLSILGIMASPEKAPTVRGNIGANEEVTSDIHMNGTDNPEQDPDSFQETLASPRYELAGARILGGSCRRFRNGSGQTLLARWGLAPSGSSSTWKSQ